MSNITFEIEKLYIEFFDRPADSAGLQFYTNAVNNGSTIADVAHAMEQSAEYKSIFNTTSISGGDWNVDVAYMHMFGRHATKPELDTWGAQMVNAIYYHTSTADVIMAIGNAAQGYDLAYFMDKVFDAMPASLVGVQTLETYDIAY
jgi:hypothetical protein